MGAIVATAMTGTASASIMELSLSSHSSEQEEGGTLPGVLDATFSFDVTGNTLTLTVDGREVYNRELTAKGPRGVRFLKKAVGIGEENFNKSIGISAGKHEIVAHLESADDGTEHRQQVVVEMERGEHRKLRLSAGSGYGSPLSLKLD